MIKWNSPKQSENYLFLPCWQELLPCRSTLSTAHPALMHFFTVDAATIQWLTTGFMLMMCVMMPVSPWLLNNISFKHLYLSVLALLRLKNKLGETHASGCS